MLRIVTHHWYGTVAVSVFVFQETRIKIYSEDSNLPGWVGDCKELA